MKIIGSYIISILSLCLALFLGYESLSTKNKSNENSMDMINSKEEIGRIVEDVIMQKPEIIIKSIENMQYRKEKEIQEKVAKLVKSNMQQLQHDPNTPALGNNDAKINIVEFFDYGCIHCKNMLPIKKKVLENFEDVKIVTKHLPVLGRRSVLSAKASLAANVIDPTKYQEYHYALLRNIKPVTEDVLLDIATNIGLNKENFKSVMHGKDVSKILDETHKLALKIGIQGTPAYVIDGEFIPGSLSHQEMVEYIAKALSKVNENITVDGISNDNSKMVKMDDTKKTDHSTQPSHKNMDHESMNGQMIETPSMDIQK